jgi:sensor histidine kinase regulating citrate/malate metabolism
MVDETEMARLLRSPKMRTGQCLAITVEDEGEGMTEETVRHCFEPAFSTRLRRTGCGISEVYGIVCGTQDGGIALWTHPGLGTRITAYIPLKSKAEGGKTEH